MEQKYEVKSYTIEYLCDECQEGILIPDGDIVLCSYPAQYPHRCTKCRMTRNFYVRYPKMEFVRI